MANYTNNLRLFKYDTDEDADQPYDINKCLNNNWEIIDTKYGEVDIRINNKQDKLVSGTNIKTINGSSILGNGNLTIETSSVSYILNTIYPVGAIYISVADICPMERLNIGVWQKIGKGKCLQNADDTHRPGDEIAAGLPNIKGLVPASENVFRPYTKEKDEKGNKKTYTSNVDNIKDADGKLIKITKNNKTMAPSEYYKGNNGYGCFRKLAYNVVSGKAVNDSFDQDLWSFEASIGSSIFRDDVTTVQPSALVVNIWRRIA